MLGQYDDIKLYLDCKRFIEKNIKKIEYYEDIETDLASFVSYRIFENYELLDKTVFVNLVTEFLMIKKNISFNALNEATQINIKNLFKSHNIQFSNSYIEILLDLFSTYDKAFYYNDFNNFLNLLNICEKRAYIICKIYSYLPKPLSKHAFFIERKIFRKYNLNISKHFNNKQLDVDINCILEILKNN